MGALEAVFADPDVFKLGMSAYGETLARGEGGVDMGTGVVLDTTGAVTVFFAKIV